MPLHFLEQCKHLSYLNKMQLFVLLVMSVFPGSVKLLIFGEFFSTKILGVDLPPTPTTIQKQSFMPVQLVGFLFLYHPNQRHK